MAACLSVATIPTLIHSHPNPSTPLLLQSPKNISMPRKLLFVPEIISTSPGFHSGISSNTLSALADSEHKPKSNNDDDYVSNGVTSSGYGGFSGYRLNESFDTSMVLTALVLLTALLFMGFFSMYMRRFGTNSSSAVHPSRSRRRPAGESGKGVDKETLDSLPVYSYNGGAAKQGSVAVVLLECVICLSEFEEGEGVKVIPFCGHVFHVGCVDTWLECHVTCPLCRTANLLRPEEERCDAVSGDAVGGLGLGSTVDGRDTWSDEVACVVGPDGLRRCGSCTWFSERAELRRSLSF